MKPMLDRECWDETTGGKAERTTKAEVYRLNKRRCERIRTARRRHEEPGKVETMNPLW